MGGAKRCTHCGEIKPLDQFWRSKHAPDGRRAGCSLCMRMGKKAIVHKQAVADPTPAEIEERKAIIQAENFQREMAGEVLGEWGGGTSPLEREREPRVYHRSVREAPAFDYSLRWTFRERMSLAALPRGGTA